MLVVHVLGFFAILIPLVYVSPPLGNSISSGETELLQMAPQKASAHDVFTVFSNGGAWPSQGLSFFVGLIGTVYAMFGELSSHELSPHTLIVAQDAMQRFT